MASSTNASGPIRTILPPSNIRARHVYLGFYHDSAWGLDELSGTPVQNGSPLRSVVAGFDFQLTTKIMEVFSVGHSLGIPFMSAWMNIISPLTESIDNGLSGEARNLVMWRSGVDF
ncbi:hypothetical protein [Nocardia higoensis]|uniref:hypothetical protein n=1 Tax=Nocardia higoensis TaxID=228599 RepID=UPI0012F6EF43|nr:hypothetical protein [Nocardia higoensis]